jgi:hypothetical protein
VSPVPMALSSAMFAGVWNWRHCLGRKVACALGAGELFAPASSRSAKPPTRMVISSGKIDLVEDVARARFHAAAGVGPGPSC